jgi:hypothetical protein
MRFSSSRLFLYLICTAGLCASALAQGSHDRTQFGHEIVVEQGEKATDVTCFSCSVRVRGRVSGDLTTFGGTVVIEQDGEVMGDTTVFAGDLHLESGARVREVTVFGGKLRRDPSASVRGDVTTFGGGAGLWLFIVFGLPFVVVGAFIALIVWLIRKFSRRQAVPAAVSA